MICTGTPLRTNALLAMVKERLDVDGQGGVEPFCAAHAGGGGPPCSALQGQQQPRRAGHCLYGGEGVGWGLGEDLDHGMILVQTWTITWPWCRPGPSHGHLLGVELDHR